jgi:hypothetical protein
MSLFVRFLNIYFWIKIFLSPFVIGLLFAFVSWFKYNNVYGQIGAMLCITAGTVVGIFFAEHIRKTSDEAFIPNEPEVQNTGEQIELKDPHNS